MTTVATDRDQMLAVLDGADSFVPHEDIGVCCCCFETRAAWEVTRDDVRAALCKGCIESLQASLRARRIERALDEAGLVHGARPTHTPARVNPPSSADRWDGRLPSPRG